MKKKQVLVLLSAGMLLLAACGNPGTKEAAETKTAETAEEEAAEETTADAAEEKAEEAEDEKEEAEETSEKASNKLPAYEYPDEDSYLYAVNAYLISEKADDYEVPDVTIPVVRVAAVDESNPEDILLYADSYIYNYVLQDGNTLFCKSGGDYPGVLHLKKTEDGYEVTAFDEVGDGSDWEPSAKKLFGKHYDAFMKLYSDDKDSEKQRLQVVSEYVKRNNLPITQYQDYGWDPVGL